VWTRRQILAGLGALGALGSGFALAGTAAPSGPARPRLVLVLLRGGLDGLAAIRPVGDVDFAALRGGASGPALNTDFALHEALADLHPLWTAGQMAVVHALGSPYGGRSHFEAMDVLENGTDAPGARRDGWLNRALAGREGADPVAIGASLPLVLRGEQDAGNVSTRGGVPLYEADPVLGPVLREGLEVREEVAGIDGGSGPTRGARFAGSMLAADDGPDIAVVQIGGFDTHARQGPVLSARLAELSAQVAALREALGAAWDHTVVCAVSEFGRAVAPNGTDGTDHGRGGVALLLGGAVAGGAVHGDWPGLSFASRFEGRDLMPTTDTRALFKGLLRDHLRIAEATLEDTVFPDSRAVRPIPDLVRG
jgi:uncharacterized protein (DUF1501 family)